MTGEKSRGFRDNAKSTIQAAAVVPSIRINAPAPRPPAPVRASTRREDQIPSVRCPCLEWPGRKDEEVDVMWFSRRIERPPAPTRPSSHPSIQHARSTVSVGNTGAARTASLTERAQSAYSHESHSRKTDRGSRRGVPARALYALQFHHRINS